jgi:transketolase
MVTVEEHNLVGGLGSRISDVLTDEGLCVDLLKFGIPDTYAEVAGDQKYLRGSFGLDVSEIVEQTTARMRRLTAV